MNLLKRLPVLSLIGLIAFGQPRDVEGWGKIKWGMTVSDIMSVFGRQASVSTDSVPTSSALVPKLIIKDVRIGEIGAKAVVLTAKGSDRVQAVEVEATDITETPAKTASVFSTLKELLIEKYGTPIKEEAKIAEFGITRTSALWVFPSTSITLLRNNTDDYGIGFVTILYKAVDKKALDLL